MMTEIDRKNYEAVSNRFEYRVWIATELVDSILEINTLIQQKSHAQEIATKTFKSYKSERTESKPKSN